MTTRILGVILFSVCAWGMARIGFLSRLNARRQLPVRRLTWRGMVQLTGKDAERYWRDNSVRGFIMTVVCIALLVWFAT